jgi:uncharacterized RDD family membrane protein YckC
MSGPDPAGPAPTALAPQHLRLFALIVDYLLAVALLNGVDKLLLGAEWDLRPIAGGPLRAGWLLGAAALLLLRDVPRGQSPGKWFTGIAVARADDPALLPPLWARVLRNATLPLLPVEAVLVFVDRYGRRLGDRLAGTVMVAQARPAPATRRLLGMAIVFMVSTLAIQLLEYWNVRRTAAYPAAVGMARGDPRVEAAFGPQPAFSAPGLTRSDDGARMRVRLNAEGSRGAGHVSLELRLAGPPPRWELERLELEPPPAPAPRSPPVQDAPQR